VVQPTLTFWTVVLSFLTLLIVTANFLLTHLRTPRSKIRIKQLSDDMIELDSNSQPEHVILKWDLTAINDGKRDGNLADPVFINATLSADGREELITPDDIGRGSVAIQFREKDEEKVVSLSNDKIRINHKLSKKMGIHEYISDYDTMTFRYSVMVEDGVTPYDVGVEGTWDISGNTIRWNRE
jgi:hypothetical protein